MSSRFTALLAAAFLVFRSGWLDGNAFSAEPSPAIAFRNATIHTATQDEPLRNATLLIQAGKIVAVNPAEIPAGAQIRDLAGAVIIPGLVDTHSHIGLYGKPGIPAHADGNEMSGPVQGIVRADDAVWPGDPGIRMAVAGGVTTANIMPGSGNVIGGQTLYCKLRGHTVEAMRITGKLADGTVILGGLKMANGENPKGYGRNRQQAPFTRMKVAALQRAEFVKAKEYQRKWQEYRDALAAGKKDIHPPARDLALEPLVEVLERKRTVHFHCHRADDIVTAIRISEEFGFELVLQHASEGYRLTELLAKKQIPVSLTLLDSPGGKAETIGRMDENAAVLHQAGVPVTINTDDFVTESRFFLRTGSIAVRGGMPEAAALRAITRTAAQVLHLDHRLGSLEPGKDADFVILSGPPFSVYTKVLETWIDGQKVFDSTQEQDRPYRDGGFALPRGMTVPTLPPVAVPPRVPMPAGKEVRLPDAKIVAVRAGRLHTMGPAGTIRDGVILIEAGKITAVGPAKTTPIPAGATQLLAAEVTPGLIDCFGSAGLSGAWNIPADQDQDELGDPHQADLRVLDGFNPHEPLLEQLRSNGITIVHSTPGRKAIIAGRSGVFRLRGATVNLCSLKPTFALIVNLGEPVRGTKGGPETRMGVAGVIRKAFVEAQHYATKAGKDLTRSLRAEALLPALQGQAPVIFVAHRADDIRTALRIADEFRLKPILALGTEAYLLADELAQRKLPVIVHPTMQRAGSSMETVNTLLANAAILKARGISVTLGTSFEGYVPKIRDLRAEAAMAAVNGLGQEAALQAITIDAAKLLGIDRDYGSLEPGKVADLVLYDGDPFEHTTHVRYTLMSGKIVFDRNEYLALPIERRLLPLLNGGGLEPGCCLGW